MKRWLVFVALVLGLLLPALPASAGSTSFSTTNGCKASGEAGTWFGKTTLLYPYTRCAYVRVRLVYKSKLTGARIYGFWRYAYPDTTGSTVAVVALDTNQYTLLFTHHVAEDLIGFVAQRTCFPGQTTCVSGLVLNFDREVV